MTRAHLARVMLCAVLAAGSINAAAQARADEHGRPLHVPTIEVSGAYHESATPDVAYLDLSVRAEAKGVSQAKEAADGKLRALKRLADSSGIAAKHIKTSHMSIQPRYSYQNGRDRTLEGYDVVYSMTITLEKLDEVGTFMERAVEAGVDQVSGIRYDIREPKAACERALKAAALNARAKAQMLAETLGQSVEGVVRIQEGGAQCQSSVMPVPMMRGAAMMMADSAGGGGEAPPMGEVEIGAQVSVIFRLKN